MKPRKPFAYLAAPLFNPMERDRNAQLTAHLERYLDVFLPQRDGLLLRELIASGMVARDAKRLVFNADMGAIHDADLLIAVLDGRTVDEGVSFEVGAAYALGKRCIGLKTDDRSLLLSGDNPMLECAFEMIALSDGELVQIFRDEAEAAGVQMA